MKNNIAQYNSINKGICFSIIFILTTSTTFAQDVESKFQAILDSIYSKNIDAIGIQVHVESEKLNLSWSSSVGYADKQSGEKLKANQPLLIASNTKTFVASTVLILVERGYFSLDDPIKKLLSEKTSVLLEKDGYKTEVITVRNLLSHTAGIFDYVDDDYFKFADENRDYQWSRDEQIELSVDKGDPIGNPGESYKYGDINYLLLSEIIEQITEKPFYTAIREIIDYEKNNLNSTWFINLEKPATTTSIAHQYWKTMNWDAYDINPSWDLYGGGGLVSTTRDMAIFFQKLFNGKLIKDQGLLEQMHTHVLPADSSAYCLGIMNISFYKRTTGYFHGGFWGTGTMYLPEYNTTISVATLERDKKDLNHILSNEFVTVLEKEIN